MIFRWAEIAQHFPELVNAVTHTPLIADLIKGAAGITQKRKMPAFAKQTFKSWFAERKQKRVNSGSAPSVILWPDTFNNYFFPHTAEAAVEVLEAAGFQVKVPEQNFCCGRPLYDYGFLTEAKAHARRILDALGDEISAGTPVVFLEPSCGSVFRDEVTNLFPGDRDAQRLRLQSFLFGEFLERAGYQPPSLKRKALVHGHCHQKALVGMKHEASLLQRTGLDAEILDSGCCGLAGSFGYEADHYDVSMKIGERVLLPRVRSADRDTMIIADGFSCREQIMHGTRRHAMHTAEVLQMALHQPQRRKGRYVETGWVQEEPSYPVLTAALGAGAVLLAGSLLLSKRSPLDRG
jgi:Fe-S oxidoreductase